MNAAQQYIDLFRENRDLIDKHSSAILNGRREAAIRDFELLGLPGKNLEEFLHTDVESFYAPDYGLNLARIKPAENIRETFRCAVPDLESRLYFFIGDTFRQGTNGNLPEGVIACSLCEAAAQHPELVDRYYGKLAQTDKDGTVALNTALVQDGFFLFVPRHVKIEEPLQIVNLMHGSHDFMANRRLLVVLEEGAQVRLLSCDHTLDKGTKFLSGLMPPSTTTTSKNLLSIRTASPRHSYSRKVHRTYWSTVSPCTTAIPATITISLWPENMPRHISMAWP